MAEGNVKLGRPPGKASKVYKKRTARPLDERLYEMIAIDELTGCWIWIGNIGTNGYGRIGVDNVVCPTHRVSYEFHKGPIPDGLVLMHTCDVRPCINPDHLVPGTKKDNTADMMSKGRNKFWSRLGKANPAAKLDEEAVRHIRQRIMTCRAYAELYGVSAPVVNKIMLRQNWKHVPD